MVNFKPVSSKVNLPEIEQEITNFWKEKKIFEKSIEKNPESNSYNFVDGPPFVTGLPHYGHLLTSIAKDMIPRYQTMNGKRVRRVWGWDCHGLPIEEKVNKMFGIKSSKQLEEKMGVDKYVEACRNYVLSTSSDWEWYIDRVGRWVDMDHAYSTMNIDFMESVIWGFKQIYDKGFVYKGKRVSLFSTDTSTPVSNFEVAMDNDNYQDVEDLSAFVKFELKTFAVRLSLSDLKIEEDKKIYLVAWTTTPWTIPANFALAVNKAYDYGLVEYEDQLYIIAKDRLEDTFNVTGDQIGTDGEAIVKIKKEFKGEDLAGLEYKPVFDYYLNESADTDFHVYLSDDVTITEGTGVLHIAPAFGEVDFNLGLKHSLSAIPDIDEAGKMTVDPWKGVYIREASPLIVESLQEKGSLLRSELYKHRLPFYRGSNPLIYMAQEAYFIDVQKIKQRMLELNQEINWIPDHIKNGRFAHTIETSPDWCISRNRYWATIMPIWRSKEGDEIVVGSIEEMMQYTDQITKKEVNGKTAYFFKDKPMDLHRDIGDKIIFEKNGKQYHRIPEVLDVWMDSGSVPFAEHHYPFKKETFNPSRSADFIIEYVGQVRAWFNVLLRISTLLFDKPAFINALCHGTIAGNDGRKMSKSYGNYPDPKMLLEKYGGDALRVYFMGSPVMKGDDMNFMEEGVAESYRFLLVFWNTYKFFIDYASVGGWSCENTPADIKERLTVMDRWVLARLTQVTLDVRKSYDAYDVVDVTNALKAFIINDFSTWYIRRSRDRFDLTSPDRDVALAVLYGILVTLTKLMAPLTPFMAEEMFKNLTGEESVHLQNFPQGDKSLLDEKLVKDMVVVRKIAELGNAKRKDAGIKIRQPLLKLEYQSLEILSKELEQVLVEELNIKTIEHKKSSKTETTVKLDTNITPILQEEGEARDLIRSIQQLRKEQNLTLSDKTNIEAPSWPEKFTEQIVKSTASESIKKGIELKVSKI